MAGRGRTDTSARPEKLWVTSGEVARALNMTDAAIRRWAREGLLEAVKTPGGQYRFRREALSTFTKARQASKSARSKPSRAGSR